MSPSAKSKTKSKDNNTANSAKEQQKPSIKPSGSTNAVSGNLANDYNPISGTFHALEIPSAAFSPSFNDNGRFRNIDDSDEHSSSSHGTVSEYDSVSNNGSCSGESEDPKEKIANSSRQETVAGLDSDRREKIRLKNEKKHQRQRERRLQELHERCSSYLMSRKLERLSLQLVGMGFSHEQATLALMLTEGRVEESVNWLFEGSEEEAQNRESGLGNGRNLNIDINEELAQISEMEVRYKCSKQEVERAVVACEGDLVKAEETLCAQKRKPPTPSRLEDIIDTNNLRRLHEKPIAAAAATTQQRMDERDFNYKSAIPLPTYSEPGSRNSQPLNHPKSLANKWWGTAGSTPAFSSSMLPSMQAAPASTKFDVRLGFAANEGKNVQHIAREPVMVMQLPQSINAKQNKVPSISVTPSVTAGWYSNSVPTVENTLSNKLLRNQSAESLGHINQSSEQIYHPVSFQETPFLSRGPVDSTLVGLGGTWSITNRSPSPTGPTEWHGGSYGKTGASFPSLAAPSSLGLFTGWGPAGSLGSSHVDWNSGGPTAEFDYTSIDWTLDSNLVSSKSNGLWLGLSSLLRNTSTSTSTSGTRTSRTNSSFLSGLHDSGVGKETPSSVGSREWTSPFAGKDMFSLPRHVVTSPSPWN